MCINIYICADPEEIVCSQLVLAVCCVIDPKVRWLSVGNQPVEPLEPSDGGKSFHPLIQNHRNSYLMLFNTTQTSHYFSIH